MKPTLVILAAGMGARYGGLKQIDSIGPSGETILDYSIFDAIRSGFGKVVFIIKREIEAAFRETIGQKYEGQILIDFAFQELDSLPEGFFVPKGRVKPWGTGHALLVAKEILQEPFAVINADDFYGPTSFSMIHDSLISLEPNNNQYYMVGFCLDNTLSEHGQVSRGICSTKENYLLSIVEKTAIRKEGERVVFSEGQGEVQELSPNSIASMNFWGFHPKTIFPLLENEFKKFLEARGQELKSEFYLPSAVDVGIQEQGCRVRVLESSESWFGVTYAADKSKVQEKILEKIQGKIYPKQLFP